MKNLFSIKNHDKSVSVDTRQKQATSRDDKKRPTQVALRGLLKDTSKPEIHVAPTSRSNQPIQTPLNSRHVSRPQLTNKKV
jgi:hypothetical protein